MREENRKIHFLDETCINPDHTKSKVWIDQTVKSAKQAFLSGLSTGLRNHARKGKRMIITHIGSEAGFVGDGLLVFESKKSGDCHEEMNAKVFENRFAKVFLQLEDQAVIVIDNAAYHSRKLGKNPTAAWKKQDMKD